MLRHIAEDVSDERVLEAMAAVPRDAFVPPRQRREAYDDRALAIGYAQTISQPLIVAIMTEALELQGDERVLEIGTGSGYQAAILGRIAAEVVTVERVPELYERARATLAEQGADNVVCLLAGDELGAADRGPFDAIIVTAALPELPPALVAQLRDGGRIVAPVGSRGLQELVVAKRRGATLDVRELGPCRFVPVLGSGGFDTA